MVQSCADQAIPATKWQVLIVAPANSAATHMIYELPFGVLSGAGCSWRIIPEYYLKPQDLEGLAALILYRCIQGSTLSIVRLARRKQIKVIYELDDDLLDPPLDESWGRRYRTNHLSDIIKMFLAEVNLVKAGSPELARRLVARGYPAVYQPYTAKVCDLPDAAAVGPPYRIGYFGTPHHQNDIESIYPALAALQATRPGEVEFEFLGCHPPEWKQLQARLLPYEPDYRNFMEILAGRRWTLGLAPLRRTDFNAAKSNSKFRDFTAAGILGIYADLLPYQDTVVQGQNGWLAGEGSELWYETISNALACPERVGMVNQAGQIFQKYYSPEVVAHNWAKLIGELNRGE